MVRLYTRARGVTPTLLEATSTPRKHAFLPCGHLYFSSAVIAQKDRFNAVLIACLHVTLLNVKTWPRNLVISLDAYWYLSAMHFSQQELCRRDTYIAFEVACCLLSSFDCVLTNRWRQIHISVVWATSEKHWEVSTKKCVEVGLKSTSSHSRGGVGPWH